MKKPILPSTSRKQTTSDRRNLLIETAVVCFVERGISRTGMRDIATKAGVSVGNLYNHFPNRDHLIAEIARIETVGLSEVVAQVADCSDPRQAVDTFVKSYFSYCADYTSAVLAIEITSEALRNPAVERLFSGNRAMLIDALAKAIVDSGQGGPRAEYDSSEVISGLILDTIEGFALRVGLSGKNPHQADIKALLAFVRNALSSRGA